jgi:hypothetical protein
MNRIIPDEELKMLLEKTGGIRVSIFTPTHELGKEERKHPIRFKNLLREVEGSMSETGLRSAAIREFLEPARELIADSAFWRRQDAAAAVFITTGWFRTYSLPYETEPTFVVADRFHLKPVLPLLASDYDYVLLSLSQNRVRVFECQPYAIHEIRPKNIPWSLEEALQYEDPEKQLQFHTQTSAAEGSEQRAAMFHGHGAGNEDSKNDIRRFFRMIAKGLQPLLAEKRKPLLLAGVEYLHSIYKDANLYSDLLETGIAGSTENFSLKELQEKSWGAMQAYFREKLEMEFSRYEELSGTARASSDIRTIVPASCEGRVDTLFVTAGSHHWGSFVPGEHSPVLHAAQQPGDVDLSDFAAVHSFRKGGRVYVRNRGEFPRMPECAAIFRY